MAKKGILFLLIIGLFVFVGCEEEIDSNIDWTSIATEWENTTKEEHFSYVDIGLETDPHLDITVKVPRGDIESDDEQMYFIYNFSMENNTYSGTYEKNGEAYDIVISFSYNEDTQTLSLACVGQGDLDGENFSFTPDPDYGI